MTQIRRRIIFCGIIGLLLVAGAILQARAADSGDANSPQPTALTHPDMDGEKGRKAGEALKAGLTCLISVMNFQLPQAENACGSAIDLRPGDPMGYKFRGLAYLLGHRFERAEMDFRDAVRLDPKDPDSQAGYAQSLSGQGRFDEAVSRFGIALAMSPHDVRYLSARCWARAGEGKDFNAAFKDCDLALKLAPQSSVAYDARALAHLRAGHDMAAQLDYTSSLKLQPKRATALFGRGIAEFRNHSMAAARKDLSLARQVDPEIDDTYVLVGVLEAGCSDGRSACSLPQELRATPRPPSKYLSVSFPDPRLGKSHH